ncbi:MAG TPA: tail fiber protein [Stellaceae bacterium]|nr:tail fiber protein [Stellaceae bacterium]
MPIQPFIGELMIFAGNFAPRGWALCDGQLLAISQNQALFSILGTTYGGNGTQTFALPDLRGRLTLGVGQGPGLNVYDLGQTDGEQSHTLIAAEAATHTHSVNAVNNGNTGGSKAPGGGVLLGAPYAVETGSPPVPFYSNAAPSQVLNGQSVGLAGGSQPHNNLMPSLVVNWCIALQGIFPTRN